MSCWLIFVLFILVEVHSKPTDISSKKSCLDVLKSAHASENFGENVAHALHSITVRELRKFESNVTEENNIPTINVDLTSDQAILPYAPDRRGPNEDLFSDDAMKTVDEVLSHMDDPNYMIKELNTIERLVHAFHMKTMWSSIRHKYEMNKNSPPTSSDVCLCALDVENNGVLMMLRYIALIFREPELIYGNQLEDYGRNNKMSVLGHAMLCGYHNVRCGVEPNQQPKTRIQDVNE
uniref:Uncharacterized protein n=1 Tax=Acrobeloides nanus TaxID=290746 RepID=A0A914CLG9_9BILA